MTTQDPKQRQDTGLAGHGDIVTDKDFKIDPNIYSGVKQLEKIKLFTMHRDAAVDRMKAVVAATNDERTSDFMNSMIRQLMTRSKPGTRFSKPHLSEKQLSALERIENRLGIQVPPEQMDLPTREEVREASDYYHNVIQHQRNAEMLAKRNSKEIDEIVDEEIKAFLDEKCQKGYKTHAKRKTKKMFGRTYRNCVKAEENKDPEKGTGKKPNGSGRRLYTDEDPSDTVAVKFSSVSDIQDTFSKASFKNKSHKRQSQIINLVHQRVRAAYNNAKDPETRARLKKAFSYAKKRKEASKEKTKRMKK